MFGWYSKSLSELVIASEYFGSRAARSYNLLGYLGLKLYQVLEKLSFKKQWSDAKRRDKLSNTINHMMDVVYLQRRI